MSFLNHLCRNLVNTLVIAILMACLGQFSYPYNNKSLEIVWRTSYAIGLIPLAFILYWRVFVLKCGLEKQASGSQGHESHKEEGTTPQVRASRHPLLAPQFRNSFILVCMVSAQLIKQTISLILVHT